ncbi:MAG: hypothetical protein JNK41_07320 [Saprospiraceae bacterium]|nr:hypothetical protein [Saprospiraceae bacterium]
MVDKKVIQISRWCALSAVVLMVSFLVMISIAPSSSVGVLLAIAGILILTPVFYALYLIHRSESAILSLTGFIIWFPAAALDLASLLNHDNIMIYIIDCFIFSLPLMIFGFLAFKSEKMPNGISLMALLSGIFNLISGVATLYNNKTIGMFTGMGGLVFMLIWFTWLFFILSENLLETKTTNLG